MAAIKWREIDGRKGGGEIKSHNRMWGALKHGWTERRGKIGSERVVVYVTACKSINGESEERKADVCLRCTGGLETRKRRGEIPEKGRESLKE